MVQASTQLSSNRKQGETDTVHTARTEPKQTAMRGCPPPSLLLLLFLLLVGRAAATSTLKICAFSLQSLDATKASNYRLMHTLTRVVSRCSICLLQEVKDPAAIKALVSSLNRESDRYENHEYQSVISEPLGNSPDAMERYVFIYRKQDVILTNQYQYRKKSSFVREPFVVQFHSKKLGESVKDFVLVPLRAEPDLAVQEMDRLYDVYEKVVQLWSNTNVMFLGNFHAGCAYMTRADRSRIRLFTRLGFYWMIGRRVDTTASDQTSCAYDRIVVSSSTFLKTMKPYSAQAYNYGKTLKLPLEQVLALSNRYPVEVEIKSSALLLQATPFLILLAVLQSIIL
ncbi:deoxyribonuclease-1-like [Genypterus blacodes]|uniref:deoxyribonuclease-1-like n=1 Tax=Genypterus blacodes TaxID=154954 RepID=UPI003F769844